jgi:hypothetical protein
MNTLPQEVLDQLVKDLTAYMAANPDYKIVITGHSLGGTFFKPLLSGAKAMLATLYLRLHHNEIVPDALYTYGQPVTGSTNFNDYFAECYGPENYVRIVSSDDIIPWVGTSSNRQHSSLVHEIFAPDFNEPKFIKCMGPKDKNCSAGTTCKSKSWDHHSVYAGISCKAELIKIRDLESLPSKYAAASAYPI